MKLFEGQPIIDAIMNALTGKDITIYGGDSLSTSLCYVSDMIDGLVRLMGSETALKLVNIGGDTILKMVDVAELIVQMTGSTSQVLHGEALLFLTRKGLPNLERVKSQLGWFPLITLKDGLKKTIEYAVANRQALQYGPRS